MVFTEIEDRQCSFWEPRYFLNVFDYKFSCSSGAALWVLQRRRQHLRRTILELVQCTNTRDDKLNFYPKSVSSEYNI